MQGPGGELGRTLETVMRHLRAAEVLKEDLPDHPIHYNRAWSTVLNALESLHGEAPVVDPDLHPAVVSSNVMEGTVPDYLRNYIRRNR